MKKLRLIFALVATLGLGIGATACTSPVSPGYDLGTNNSYDLGTNNSYDLGTNNSYDLGTNNSYDLGTNN